MSHDSIALNRFDTVVSGEQDETDSYTNVSFFGHELWSVQENGDIRKCTCECVDAALYLVNRADPYLHIIFFSCSALNLRQNAK